MQHCQVMSFILRTKKQGLSRISALLAVLLSYIVQHSLNNNFKLGILEFAKFQFFYVFHKQIESFKNQYLNGIDDSPTKVFLKS